MNLVTEKSERYELIDSGITEHGGEKLERFGTVILRRPDPEVLWHHFKTEDVWNAAHAHFVRSSKSGQWKKKENMADEWQVTLGQLRYHLHLGGFKHVGIFPEQMAQWQWMVKQVESRKSVKSVKSDTGEKENKVRILNLFGYTGGASVALAHAGAEVTHVDSAESSVGIAKANARLNNLTNIRFIVDDVRKFVEREIKRGVKYDAIIMDPPVYGKGVRKSMWHIEKDFLPLLTRVEKLLSTTRLFVVISGYASEYSHLSYANALSGVFTQSKVESGELAIKESDTDRLLPAGIFARILF